MGSPCPPRMNQGMNRHGGRRRMRALQALLLPVRALWATSSPSRLHLHQHLHVQLSRRVRLALQLAQGRAVLLPRPRLLEPVLSRQAWLPPQTLPVRAEGPRRTSSRTRHLCCSRATAVSCFCRLAAQQLRCLLRLMLMQPLRRLPCLQRLRLQSLAPLPFVLVATAATTSKMAGM